MEWSEERREKGNSEGQEEQKQEGIGIKGEYKKELILTNPHPDIIVAGLRKQPPTVLN